MARSETPSFQGEERAPSARGTEKWGEERMEMAVGSSPDEDEDEDEDATGAAAAEDDDEEEEEAPGRRSCGAPPEGVRDADPSLAPDAVSSAAEDDDDDDEEEEAEEPRR